MKRVIVGIWATVLIAIGQGDAESIHHMVAPTGIEERQAQLLKDVDEATQMLTGKASVEYGTLTSVALQVESWAEVIEMGEKKDASQRAQTTKQLLGDMRYNILERSCLIHLEDDDEKVRIVTRRVLAQTLGSHVRENQWAMQLRTELNSMVAEDNNSLSYDEVFSLSENLAYLGNPIGLPVLLGTIAEETSPSWAKINAMLALQRLKVSIPESRLETLMLDNDGLVASTAFDCAQDKMDQPFVLHVAKKQLERFDHKIENRVALTDDDINLLSDVGYVFRMRVRSETLTEGDKAFAKAVVKHLLETAPLAVKERVVYLFADLCGEEDEELLTTLIGSSSPILHAQAIYGLSRCPVEMLEKYRKKLTELQKDPDWKVRLFASNGLQKLANAEKARQGTASP